MGGFERLQAYKVSLSQQWRGSVIGLGVLLGVFVSSEIKIPPTAVSFRKKQQQQPNQSKNEWVRVLPGGCTTTVTSALLLRNMSLPSPFQPCDANLEKDVQICVSKCGMRPPEVDCSLEKCEHVRLFLTGWQRAAVLLLTASRPQVQRLQETKVTIAAHTRGQMHFEFHLHPSPFLPPTPLFSILGRGLFILWLSALYLMSQLWEATKILCPSYSTNQQINHSQGQSVNAALAHSQVFGYWLCELLAQQRGSEDVGGRVSELYITCNELWIIIKSILSLWTRFIQEKAAHACTQTDTRLKIVFMWKTWN